MSTGMDESDFMFDAVDNNRKLTKIPEWLLDLRLAERESRAA